MIINKAGRTRGRGMSLAAAARFRVHYTVRYITEGGQQAAPLDANGQALRFTNLASDDPESVIQAMENWKTLRSSITDPVQHFIISPEKADRVLSAAEWQQAIDTYREARGLGDAPYIAQLHQDGHDGRHPQHLHLVFLRIRSDGSAVSDSWDSAVCRKAAREIEARLGLQVNAGAAESSKYNGRDKHTKRDRAGERQGFTPEQTHVDPARVHQAIARSASVAELRKNLAAEGIDMRTRTRDGGIYAWSLRNTYGPKEWVSGSKLTPSNELGWQKVADQLTANREANRAGRPTPAPSAHAQAWPPRQRRANGYKKGRAGSGGLGAGAGQQPPRQLADQAEQAVAEGLAMLKDLLGRIGRRQRSVFSADFGRKAVAEQIAEARAILAADVAKTDSITANSAEDRQPPAISSTELLEPSSTSPSTTAATEQAAAIEAHRRRLAIEQAARAARAAVHPVHPRPTER